MCPARDNLAVASVVVGVVVGDAVIAFVDGVDVVDVVGAVDASAFVDVVAFDLVVVGLTFALFHQFLT